MKTKSIVYNSFVPQVDSIPVIKQNESPVFKYTGYKPRYKWSDDDSNTETTATSETTVTSSPEDTSTSESTSSQVTFQDPSSIDWSKIAGYENTPIITQSQTPTVSSTTPATRPRGQHIFKTPDIQVGEMQELLDAFADAGISLRITSGTRSGATTKQGNQSWHSQGRALDVTPVTGQTPKDFEDLAEAIRNSPDLVAYMKEHGYGIYDETSSDTLSKTGGTGAHWHIGPDKVAIAGLETILKGKQGLKIPILFAKEGTKTQRYGTRKEQRRNDRVTKMISREINKKNQNVSPITGLRYEEPLQPLGQEIVSFLPGVGDVIEAGNIVNDIKNKNYLPAILGTTLFLLPGNIPQIVRKLPEGTKNAIKIKTFLPERLETGAIKRTHLPEKVNNKPIQEAMLDIPIEIGDSKGKAALYDFDNNKIILDKNLKESLYPEVIPHEWSHWLDYQSSNLFNTLGTSDFMEIPEKYLSNTLKSNYFNPNVIGLKATTEVGPRLTQLLDHLGIKNGNKILTWEEWKDAMDSYIKEHPDANMKLLKESIKDELLFTDWAKTNAK